MKRKTLNQTEPSKTMPSKKWLYLLPLLVFAAMVGLLFSGLGKDPTQLESQLIGKPLPKFSKSLLLEPQRKITEQDIQGPGLINVFGSWCPSCYSEHPYLMTLARSGATKIYGLNYKDQLDKGQKFIRDLGNPYSLIIHDENGRLGIDLGVYGAPETFVLNDNNQIVYRHVGVVTESVWLTILKPKMDAKHQSVNP